MTTVPLTGAPGFRFWKDLYPSGRQGGLSYYPYSSIISGLAATWSLSAGAPAASAANVTVAVAAGSAYLDGQIAQLASSANVTVTPGAVVNGVNTYRVYLNPTRKLMPIALGASAPTTRLNGDAVADGDIYATCIDFGEYFGATGFFERVAGVWTSFDPSFKAPVLPAQPGKQRQWGGENHPRLAAGNFTVNQVEKKVYIENLYPPYTNSNSKALLRDVASLEVATASLYYHVLPLPVEATFTNGATAVTVALPFRSLFADIAASVTNTNALAIDGAALATGGYNAGTGVITLGANYTGTTGTKVVNVTPVTPANVVILSPARSVLAASMNLTNP
jgi:hypothetical protein